MWPKILGYEFGQEVPPFMWPNKFCISPNFANWFDLVIVTIAFLIATNKLIIIEYAKFQREKKNQ